MPSKVFNAAEFEATIGRIRSGTDATYEISRPLFDAQLDKEVHEDAISGRHIEAYHQVLEYHGFVFIGPQTLGPYSNGAPRVVGEWRNAQLHRAFTARDILTGFKCPEDFHQWINRDVFDTVS